MKIEISEDFKDSRAVIKVIGVGGAGGNAVNRMVDAGLRGVELIAANSDAQDLRRSRAEVRIQLGEAVTKGLGVGGDPAKGRAAAQESELQLKEALAGADMVFVTAGMGGGTGTGGAPVAAKLAKDAGALTIGVVTRPFRFEGMLRATLADNGIQELRQSVDTLLVIPNDRLFDVVEANTPSDEAFRRADDVLRKAVQSLSDVITTPGTINMDLNDLRAIMKDAGEALIGMGEAEGSNRAVRAAKEAVTSALLENVDITGAKGLIVNITGRKSTLTLNELDDVMKYIQPQVSPEAKVKVGKGFDEDLGGCIRITVVATGFPALRPGRRSPRSGLRPGTLAARYQGLAPGVQPDVRQAASGPEDWAKPAFLRLKTRKLKLLGDS
ncbi:MAG: cell division protein FtsZ [Elusimicrobia bacterium]|nr:cell division protein FtsZ [Elusimicrobiota bacterium]